MKAEFLYCNEGHFGSIYSLQLASDSNEIYSFGGDGLIICWNIENPNQGKVIAQLEEKIFSSLLIDEDLFVSCLSGNIYKINIKQTASPRKMVFHKKPVYKMLRVTDHLIAISGDGTISVWDHQTFQLQDVWQINNNGLRSIAFDQEQQRLFIGDVHGSIYLIQWPNVKDIQVFKNIHHSTVFSLYYHPELRLLISGGKDAQLAFHQIDLSDFNTLKFNAHWFTINDIIPIFDSNYIVTASRDKNIRIWNVETKSLVKDFESISEFSSKHSINTLVWASSQNVVFSAGDDKKLVAWKLYDTER